eukprot:1218845-Alexandrium_andersonii.AAC.1
MPWRETPHPPSACSKASIRYHKAPRPPSARSARGSRVTKRCARRAPDPQEGVTNTSVVQTPCCYSCSGMAQAVLTFVQG